MQTSAPLDLPRATRRYRFSMTALADVMFQLLVFFMLSSNVTPYAFLTVQSGGLQGGVVGAAPDRPDGLLTQAGTTAVWTLSPDGIVASGQHFRWSVWMICLRRWSCNIRSICCWSSAPK